MAIDSKEKIDKIDEQIKQLKAKKNSILAREKEKERKARTRNLIEMGALLNELKITKKEQLLKFINEYKNNDKCKVWFDNIINN